MVKVLVVIVLGVLLVHAEAEIAFEAVAAVVLQLFVERHSLAEVAGLDGLKLLCLDNRCWDSWSRAGSSRTIRRDWKALA